MGVGAGLTTMSSALVYQIEEMDCGPSSLAMVVRHHGRRVTLPRIRDLAGLTREGLSLDQLVQAAEALGFRATPVRTSLDQLAGLPLPGIVHWSGYHWVVLRRVGRRRVELADPARGLVRMGRQAFRDGWDGYFLSLEPGEGFYDRLPEPRADEVEPPVRIDRRAKRLRATAALLAAASTVLSVGAAAATWAVLAGRFDPRPGRLLVVAGVSLAAGFAVAARECTVRLRRALEESVDGTFYERLLLLPFSYHERRNGGDLVGQYHEGETIARHLARGPADVGAAAAGGLASIAAALVLDPAVGAILGLGAIASLAVSDAGPPEEAAHRRPGLHRMLIEADRAWDSLRGAGLERWFLERLSRALARPAVSPATADRWATRAGPIAAVLAIAALAVAGRPDRAEIPAIAACAATASVHVARLRRTRRARARYRFALDRRHEMDVAHTEESLRTSSPFRLPASCLGHLSVARVRFRYRRSGPWVLDDVSFDASPGETLVLWGPGGAGKSTVLSLLLRLHDPEQGSIRLDGIDLTGVAPESLRRGVVAPAALARPAGRSAELREAAAELGFSGVLGRRRLALLGAVLGRPQVLVVDELDGLGDREGIAALRLGLRRLLPSSTLVLATRRLEVVAPTDLVCLLDEGVVRFSGAFEDGSHSELSRALRRQGSFPRILDGR